MGRDFVENATNPSEFIVRFHVLQKFRNPVISQTYCHHAMHIKIDMLLSIFEIMLLFVIKVIRFFV